MTSSCTCEFAGILYRKGESRVGILVECCCCCVVACGGLWNIEAL